jgi:hypothetical protein
MANIARLFIIGNVKEEVAKMYDFLKIRIRHQMFKIVNILGESLIGNTTIPIR